MIWPNNKLRYKWKDDDSRKALQKILEDAWKLWTPDNGNAVNKDYIDLEESTDPDALVITATKDFGARTTVGFRRDRILYLIFGTGTKYGFLDATANMAHEIGHALGLYHEHQRSDRDAHVLFNCKNLKGYLPDKDNDVDGFCTNLGNARLNNWPSVDFIKLPLYIPNDLTPPKNCQSSQYDEDSIMHYSGGMGAPPSLPGVHRKTVLTSTRDNKPFKKNPVPSSADIARINELYGPALEERGDKEDNVKKFCGPSAKTKETYDIWDMNPYILEEYEPWETDLEWQDPSSDWDPDE
ncbi:MAG: hypothetical protein Q9172_005332 [Xanthocarpia lactea]